MGKFAISLSAGSLSQTNSVKILPWLAHPERFGFVFFLPQDITKHIN